MLFILRRQSKYQLSQLVPDSITSWNIQAVYLNPTSGMCVPTPENVDVIQDVFLRVHMPQKIVRGEHFEMIVILHNRLDAMIMADVILDDVSIQLRRPK